MNGGVGVSEPLPHYWRIAALDRMARQPGFVRQTLPQSRAHDKRLRMLDWARAIRITGVTVRDGVPTLLASYAREGARK
jgi:hypothetical protein